MPSKVRFIVYTPTGVARILEWGETQRHFQAKNSRLPKIAASSSLPPKLLNGFAHIPRSVPAPTGGWAPMVKPMYISVQFDERHRSSQWSRTEPCIMKTISENSAGFYRHQEPKQDFTVK